jgi:L-lactate utilization protein LutB
VTLLGVQQTALIELLVGIEHDERPTHGVLTVVAEASQEIRKVGEAREHECE